MGRLLTILLAIVTFPAWAETIHVAQTAAGSDDGTSAANAKSLSWLNTTGNWGAGAGKVSAGDTVVLNGTLTNHLAVGGDGSSGSPITILFATGAKFLAGSWPDPTGAIYLGAHDWITIDGGTDGRIQATNNGTAKALQQDASGIRGDGVTGITVQNLTVTNLYERTQGSTADGNRYGYAIALQDARQIVIQTNNLWGGDTMIAATWIAGVSSNWTIRGNRIGGCNHGLSLGTAQDGAYLRDLLIEGNTIDDLDVWDGNSSLHLDGMIIFVESPTYDGWISNMVVNANVVGPDIGITNTAAIFIDTYAQPQIKGSRVSNNLLIQRAPYSWNNGFIAWGKGTNSMVVNNTFVAYSQTGIGMQTGASIQVTNNLFYSVGTPLSLGPAPSVPVGFNSDRNIFFDYYSIGSGGFYHPNYAAGNLTTWRSLGFDANSVTNQPSLSAAYVPLANDTVAKDAGVSLASIFTTDAAGSTRLSPWDIGAYEYQSGGAPSGPTATAGTAAIGTLNLR